MLTSFELQLQLPVILGLLRLNKLEQFLYVVPLPGGNWYEFCYLTENILALIHVCLTLWFQTKITISKGRQVF